MVQQSSQVLPFFQANFLPISGNLWWANIQYPYWASFNGLFCKDICTNFPLHLGIQPSNCILYAQVCIPAKAKASLTAQWNWNIFRWALVLRPSKGRQGLGREILPVQWQIQLNADESSSGCLKAGSSLPGALSYCCGYRKCSVTTFEDTYRLIKMS